MQNISINVSERAESQTTLQKDVFDSKDYEDIQYYATFRQISIFCFCFCFFFSATSCSAEMEGLSPAGLLTHLFKQPWSEQLLSVAIALNGIIEQLCALRTSHAERRLDLTASCIAVITVKHRQRYIWDTCSQVFFERTFTLCYSMLAW